MANKIDFFRKMRHGKDMRILASTAIILLTMAVALPAASCDRHGGMFGQMNGSSWADYNPLQSEAEALLLEEQLSAWHEKNPAPVAKVKPAKPSFSNASSRASQAAQARLAKKVKLSQPETAQATSPKKPNRAVELASR